MDYIARKIANEPVAFFALLNTLVVAGSTLGLSLSDEKVAAVTVIINAIGGFLTRGSTYAAKPLNELAAAEKERQLLADRA